MVKHAFRAKSEPAQPLLPSVNLAKFLVGPMPWCECDCEWCPPWYHLPDECPCIRTLRGGPPSSNTEVHRTPSKRGATFEQRRKADPRCDNE